MQEEIKEILEELKDDKQMCSHCYYRIFKDDRDKLLDYITNLQEENERLNNIIDELEKYFNEELENYTIEIENKNKGKLGYTLPIKGEIKNILDKLNELKEK